MQAVEGLSLLLALALSVLTAMMSSGRHVRHWTSDHVAELLAPSTVRMGSTVAVIDPENLVILASWPIAPHVAHR